MAEQHQAQEQHEQTAEELHELKRIRREKLAELQAAGADPYQQVRFERDHHTIEIHEHFDELEGKTVRLAGRMMSKRIMGKASFSDLSDRYGRLQLYIKRDNVGDEVYKGYKKFDIGDIIGVEGEVFRTQKGEISVAVHELTLLSKNLAPLPEKWHGLKDTDMRYRQRYVDLIVNPEVRDTFEKRSAIVREIRNFMDGRGFMEVETPCLNTIPGGAAARPFITHHNALDIDMYMRIATELHLKRLIVGGFEQVYEIGRIFRNEGMDTKHNPEFTTIELYQAYTDYHGMMDITEDMIVHVCEKVLGTTKDPQRSDFVLDRAYYREMLRCAEETGSAFLRRYVQMTIDAANLRSAVRTLRMGKGGDFLRRVLVDGGTIPAERVTAAALGSGLGELYRTTELRAAAEYGTAAIQGGSLTDFEKACDDAVTRFVAKAKQVPFGVEVAIGYLAAKEIEFTAVRMIMSSRMAGIDGEIIRERLRESYV